MSKCKARGCDDRGNPWCNAPYCSDMCNITDLEDENKDLQAQLKASQDESSVNESALADWHKFGNYLYKLFGQTKYLEMCEEAKLLEKLNISLSQASELKGEG